MTVIVQCQWCKGFRELPVSMEQINRWRAGELIQSVMPELSASQRELLISRTCDDCWKDIFSTPEEVCDD